MQTHDVERDRTGSTKRMTRIFWLSMSFRIKEKRNPGVIIDKVVGQPNSHASLNVNKNLNKITVNWDENRNGNRNEN